MKNTANAGMYAPGLLLRGASLSRAFLARGAP